MTTPASDLPSFAVTVNDDGSGITMWISHAGNTAAVPLDIDAAKAFANAFNAAIQDYERLQRLVADIDSIGGVGGLDI
jgi:hypothetical protein